MITRHVRGTTTWIDLEAPSREELSSVMHEFAIDARIEEEIATPTPHPFSLSFPDYAYLILHFPSTDREAITKNQEIDFVIGKNFLITARYEVIDSMLNLHKVFEAEELLGSPGQDTKPGEILERVMRRLYASVTEDVEQVTRTMERIERDIFTGDERRAVRSISSVGRILLRFESALARHADPLSSFVAAISIPTLCGKGFSTHAAHIEAARAQIASTVSAHRATASELRATNDSMLSAAQNEVMRKLTMMAFVTFPLSLIATIFGMNMENMPVTGLPGDFWIIIVFMLLVTAGFFLFFKARRWL